MSGDPTFDVAPLLICNEYILGTSLIPFSDTLVIPLIRQYVYLNAFAYSTYQRR